MRRECCYAARHVRGSCLTPIAPLEGRHALVTGGGTGIGAAIARALGAAGATVTLVGRRAELLAEVARSLPRAHCAVADVTDAAQLAAAFDGATAAFGAPDIVIANAGAAATAPFERTTPDAWRRMMAVNLDAVFLTAQAAMPGLRAAEHGRLIVIASTAGVRGYPYTSAYVAAKHGAVGLVRALAVELAPTAITVNAVCPGFTDTDIVAGAVANITAKTGRTTESALGELTRYNPQRRLIAPDEIAAAVLWLCAPASRSVTGQTIIVAGGEVM